MLRHGAALLNGTAAALIGAAAIALSLQSDARAVPPPGKIAFSESNSDTSWIGVVTPSGRSSDDFTPPEGYAGAVEPAWSSDGSKIAYVALFYNADYTRNDIWVMNADGRGRQRLTRHGSEPAWSPDGGSIAFVRAGGIYVMNADGSRQRRLIQNASEPAWSPDGQRIAFVRGKPRIDNSLDIYAMNADGADVHRLTKTYADEQNPDWSPDGTTIAYDRAIVPKGPDAETTSHVFLMNTDGTRQRRLMKSDGYDPSWSPDGTELVYVEGTNTFLFTINANGTGARKIYPPASGPMVCDCNAPTWSKR